MSQSIEQLSISEGGLQSTQSSLNGSLRGIDLGLPRHGNESHFYAVVNTYLTKKWRSFDKDLGLEWGKNDMKKMGSWAKQFHHNLQALWDDQNRSTSRTTFLPATTENLRTLLAKIESRQAPTLLYLSGHTDFIDQEPVYLTSDSLQKDSISSDKAMRYWEMGRQLVSQPSSNPLVWITEVCECDNFMKLPYVYWCEGGEVKSEKTGFEWPWGEAQALHFAATSPGQPAIGYKSQVGAIYTNALREVAFRRDLSLTDIVLKLQNTIDNVLMLAQSEERQQHRIYSSHKFDQADLFTTLGFTLVPPSTCHMA
ncbi:hypothetical protein RSOLAG1IB_08344 [Rhizoctonia solani AG-1 IB]|nr:hypothetical protein RSOLAG1IB_08344 [Rhizoctonia solani AG-1 IB]